MNNTRPQNVLNAIEAFMNPYDLSIRVDSKGGVMSTYVICRKSQKNRPIFSLRKPLQDIEDVIIEVKALLLDCLTIAEDKLQDPSLISAQIHNPERKLVRDMEGVLTEEIIHFIVADLREKRVADTSTYTQTPA